MFVPLEDREDLGEVHIGFDPNLGINSIHRVKELQVTPSQLQAGSVDGSVKYIDRYFEKLTLFIYLKILLNNYLFVLR